MSGYNQKLLNHFIHPENVGIIEQPDGYAQVKNPVNGYITEIYLKIRDDQIQEIKFKTLGCVVTIASGSALTTNVHHAQLSTLLEKPKPTEQLTKSIIDELQEIPKTSWHCPPTAVLALYTALYEYYKNKDDQNTMNCLGLLISEIREDFKRKLDEK